MSLRRAIQLVCLVLTAAGCTSGISVTRVTDEVSALKGVPWNLPMTQFTITITRHIVKCGSEIEGSVETLASAGVAVDPDQRYVLASNGWFATSEITSGLAPSGISTSLNAESTDVTSTVISNVIGTAAKFAVGAVATAVQPGETAAVTVPELCEQAIATAVAELYPPGAASLKKQVEDATAALAVETAKVALLTAQAAADKDLAPKVVSALAAQDSARDKLAALQKKLAENLVLTTATQVVTWPTHASEYRRDVPFLLDEGVLDKWTNAQTNTTDAKEQFGVYLALYSLNSSNDSWVLPAKPATADVRVGVPVRLARTARLMICVKTLCPPTFDVGARPDKHNVAVDSVVLQTGRMYVLATSGGQFKSEGAEIKLDAAGLPTSLKIAEKVAAAVVASSTAKDVATQWGALPADIRAAELAKAQAKTNQITADSALATARATSGMQEQTGTLTAQMALINAQTALETAKQNAGLQQESAALTAQTALLSAQAALVTAQANSQIVEQTSALGAQATLINAQVAQLNAVAALAKAQAALP